MNRRLFVTIGVAFLLFMGFWLERLYTRYDREYARLSPGTTKTEVLRRFGKPGEISGCTYSLSWDDEPVGEKSAKCVQEFHYFSRARIGLWVVGFNVNDRAVTKHFLSSP